MAEKNDIEKIVSEYAEGKGLFIVAVRKSSTGKITVLADSQEGITIDECADLSRFIEKHFDRDKEDFELQVSSPGMDMPFLVKEQYYKNEGKNVEVIDNEGKKYSGILKNVNDGGFELETKVTIKTGKGKKSLELKEYSFNFEQVKSTREIVSLK
jgi:ribosome maturation factor RimP